MNPGPSPLRVLSCGIFAREFDFIDPSLRARVEPIFLDSLLHMRPALLEERLAKALEETPARPTLVVYGDCCPHMRELASAPGKSRTDAVNCIELALGRERYRRLLREGAFFFMPEWLERWREIFDRELGLGDGDLARSLMRDSSRFLVYLDTGCVAIRHDLLEEVSDYFDLPLRIEGCGLGELERHIGLAIGKLGARHA